MAPFSAIESLLYTVSEPAAASSVMVLPFADT